jgi:hypothetical protein
MIERSSIEAAQVGMDLVEDEALFGVPDFMDVPDELRDALQVAVLAKERQFWLRATHIVKDIVNRTLLRRAVYAESRCWEMENQAAEMALICNGAADRVKELEAKLEDTVAATS